MSQSRSPWPAVARWTVYCGSATPAVAVATAAARTGCGSLHIESDVSLLLSTIPFVTWLGGRGPGQNAAPVSIFGFDYYLLSPTPSLALGASDRRRLLFFANVILFVAWITTIQQRSCKSRDRDNLKITIPQFGMPNKSVPIGNFEPTRAKRIARKAERKPQETIETVPAIAARYRADGSLAFVNQTERTSTGLSQGSLQGDRSETAIHPTICR